MPRLLASWIAATSLAFALQMALVGTFLGASLAGVALLNVVAGFCLPSWVHSKLFGSVEAYRV